MTTASGGRGSRESGGGYRDDIGGLQRGSRLSVSRFSTYSTWDSETDSVTVTVELTP